jgi:hypothetical protein
MVGGNDVRLGKCIIRTHPHVIGLGILKIVSTLQSWQISSQITIMTLGFIRTFIGIFKAPTQRYWKRVDLFAGAFGSIIAPIVLYRVVCPFAFVTSPRLLKTHTHTLIENVIHRVDFWYHCTNWGLLFCLDKHSALFQHRQMDLSPFPAQLEVKSRKHV